MYPKIKRKRKSPSPTRSRSPSPTRSRNILDYPSMVHIVNAADNPRDYAALATAFGMKVEKKAVEKKFGKVKLNKQDEFLGGDFWEYERSWTRDGVLHREEGRPAYIKYTVDESVKNATVYVEGRENGTLAFRKTIRNTLHPLKYFMYNYVNPSYLNNL